jgi:16S rRNA (uracil1498-N3)-methyltransferase
MPRFFIRANQIKDQNGEQIITIVGDDAHHISRSLRMAVGEKIEVCDMQKYVYDCTLVGFTGDTVEARIDAIQKIETEPKYEIKLYQALSKGDKMETIIQKSIECGACEIIPFSSERCVVRLDGKDKVKKLERYQKIAQGAAQQSGRGIIPSVDKILTFDEMISDAKKCDLVLFCYEGEETVSIKQAIQNAKIEKSIAVVIGSEGGFSLKEANKAKENGFSLVGLGKRILRCETAPTFALSCIIYEKEL